MIAAMACSTVWTCSGLDGLNVGALDIVKIFGGSGRSHAATSKTRSGISAAGLFRPIGRRGVERICNSDRFTAVLGKKEAFKYGFASLLGRR